MKVLDEVKSIVEDELGLPFLYQSFYKLNDWVEVESLPCVCCQLITDMGTENEGGQIKDDVPFLLMFVDKTEEGLTALENQEIIDEQNTTADSFLRELEDSTEIMKNSDAPRKLLYQEFDIILTGISMKVNIKERSGSQPCTYKSWT